MTVVSSGAVDLIWNLIMNLVDRSRIKPQALLLRFNVPNVSRLQNHASNFAKFRHCICRPIAGQNHDNVRKHQLYNVKEPFVYSAGCRRRSGQMKL